MGGTWGETARFPPARKRMAATRAGMRVAAISSDGPRWLDGSAGSGPHLRRGPSLGCGSVSGRVPELYVECLLLVAPPDLESEGVSGLHRLDDITQLGVRGDGPAVRG